MATFFTENNLLTEYPYESTSLATLKVRSVSQPSQPD